MGLFGNKDEINVRLLKGQIKAICSRSFMGGSLDCDSDYSGISDTVVFAQRYLPTPQMSRALGNMNACVIASVTRYGSLTIELYVDDFVAEDKQKAFPQIAADLEGRGYGVYYKNKDNNFGKASMTITKDGSTSATWQADLTKMFNDVALYAMRPLERA